MTNFVFPAGVILDTDKLAHYDTIFSITYSDNEDEDLIFEYTYAPDYGWIRGDDWGNYWGNHRYPFQQLF